MSKRKPITQAMEDAMADIPAPAPPHDDGALFDAAGVATTVEMSAEMAERFGGADAIAEATGAEVKITDAGRSFDAALTAAEKYLAARKPVALAAKTLTGDLRDFLLDRLKFDHNPQPWSERSESAQRDVIAQTEAAVQRAVTIAVNLIAAGGRRVIRATLQQITIKDEIKAVLVLARTDEQRYSLIDATGMAVFLTVADPDEFTGERAPVEIKLDQAAMTLATAGVVHSEAASAAEQAA